LLSRPRFLFIAPDFLAVFVTSLQEYDALVAVGKEAEDNGVGMHNKTVEGLGEATIRSITWSLTPTDAVAVADVLKASPQPAIVESVMNGGNLRVLLTATAPSLSVPLNVLGIMAPKVDASAVQKPVAPSAAPAATSTAPTTKGVKVTRGDSAPGSALVHDATDGAGAGGAPKMTWAKSGAVAAVAPTAAAARPGAAGSAAPAAAAAAMPTTEPAIGLEAKAWVEARFLHRDVLVHIVGADARSGSLYGRIELVPPQAGGAGNPSVVIPAGFDLAVELLKQGMAKLHDWSLNQFAATTSAGGASSYSAQLRAAERQAKQNKLRLWHSYSGSDSSASAASRPVLRGETKFEGRVVEVVSGDTVVIAVPPKAGSTLPEERRVNLASVRAPRMGRPGGDAGQPYSVEAKEFLRRNLVGRDVVVEINYSRVVGAQPAQAGAGGEAAAAPAKEGQERQFATITFSTKKGEETDISVLLVAEGLAEAIRHRAAEVEAGERATHYEELLAAEEQAKAAKKNLHSGKEPQSASSKAIKPLDLSSDAAKAKNHLPFLKRAGTVTANVEFVFGGESLLSVNERECCYFLLLLLSTFFSYIFYLVLQAAASRSPCPARTAPSSLVSPACDALLPPRKQPLRPPRVPMPSLPSPPVQQSPLALRLSLGCASTPCSSRWKSSATRPTRTALS
jgi:endonuclease YncB( thermonuclease family)